ncbi:Glycosyl hydrolases family 28 [Verrucomicrobium sp. GAS474]|uniref:glycosyl hydrolase family 28 protein n=1 Tax=Verrucomicrobium sp. GAS474 TaxID=1882831 RepID=UPI00087B68F3|nr:glycosyl hydrolase family 28 protein [Verrucomicrobium sp. GAS474]SDU05587.1 Glycosyl hydrolases family 28 [Verrucomicrobium sp. GAS474]
MTSRTCEPPVPSLSGTVAKASPAPKPHLYPSSLRRSAVFRVRVGGIPLDVLHHEAAHHASFECGGPVEVEIEIEMTGSPQPGTFFIRPLVLGIETTLSERRLHFTLPEPRNLQIEVAGQPLLYLYARPFAPATPTGPDVRVFETGRVHEAGLIHLREGETCWIEPGAVVRGSIRAYHVDGVRIGGYGILDGGYWVERGDGERRKGIVLDHCTNARVDDILMLGPCQWMLVLGACTDVSVHGLRQIASEMSSDGIDIVGSRKIRISGCCLHNGDDNIAVKSLSNTSRPDERLPLSPAIKPWTGTVEDVVVSDSVFYNINGGSAMEIGYETTTEVIRDIHFRNIDVLAVHEFGSVFGIHNGDRACVENVTWDTIRIEHHFDTLIDIRTLKSRWNTDPVRGHVRNVAIRNVRALKSQHNDGYTVSIICGHDAAHPVTGVVFENFELGGRHVANADDLDLVTRHAHDIVFR